MQGFIPSQKNRIPADICSKVLLKIPAQHLQCRFAVFVVKFVNTSHIALVFPLLTWHKSAIMLPRCCNNISGMLL